MTGPVPAARVVFSPDDRQAILAMVDEALRTGSLTLGLRTREFEEAFAARHGNPFAVAVSSGTSALEIIFRAVGVAGREVVVPANTFFATAAAALHAGADIRLADVSTDSLGVTAATVEAALTSRTAAVVVVHIGGTISPDLDEIRTLCERRGITLIEDAAHAHGSTLAGRPAGSWGRAAAFSFYPTKVITSGEGGMITSHDARIRDEALIFRDQGKAGFLGGDHVRLGYAWRMSELHAAVGLVHLGRLDQFLVRRQQLAERYRAGLAGDERCVPLPVPAGSSSNYYKYIALLAPGIDRAEVKRALREDFGVALSGEVYAAPLHRQPVFADLVRGQWPVADDVCARHVCLPLHSDMTDDEADRVLEGLTAVLAGSTTGGRVAGA